MKNTFTRLILIGVLCSAIFTLLTAQDIGSDSIGDPYYPEMGNGGYDVQHYTLDLTVDVENNIIDGTVTIDFIATQALSTFNLDFYELEISAITVNGDSAEYERATGELTIIPNTPLAKDESVSVAVTYRGTPTTGVTSGRSYEAGWVQYDTGILVAGEPSRAARWFPVNGHPLDKATYSFIITVDEPYTVAANGLLQEVIDNGDSTTTHIWEASDPMASYLVTLGIAELELRTQDSPDNLPIRNYFPVELADRGERIFSDQAEMITLFNDLFGEYPFEAYGALVANTELSFALETQTISLFGRNTILNSSRPEDIEVLVAHELAHQWFGNSISVFHWRDVWLNEGFATYASWLWLEDQYGRNVLDQQVRNSYPNLTVTEEEAIDQAFGGFPELSLAQLADGVEANDNSATFLFEGAEVGELLATLSDTEIIVSPTEVHDLLLVILGDSLTAVQYDDLMLEVPLTGYSIAELVAWLDPTRAEFADMRLEGLALVDVVRALGDQSLVLDSDTGQAFWVYTIQYGVFNGSIPGLVILPPGDPPPDNLLHSGIYVRGAITLHALRLEVGDDDFFEIMHTYTERFYHSNASTGDFINIAEEVSGLDLTDFFEAWLFDDIPPDIPQMDLYAD